MKTEVDEGAARFNSFREDTCFIKQTRISLRSFQHKLLCILLDGEVCDAVLQDTAANSCSAVIDNVSLQER